jgi:hypothetical protein
MQDNSFTSSFRLLIYVSLILLLGTRLNLSISSLFLVSPLLTLPVAVSSLYLIFFFFFLFFLFTFIFHFLSLFASFLPLCSPPHSQKNRIVSLFFLVFYISHYMFVPSQKFPDLFLSLSRLVHKLVGISKC